MQLAYSFRSFTVKGSMFAIVLLVLATWKSRKNLGGRIIDKHKRHSSVVVSIKVFSENANLDHYLPVFVSNRIFRGKLISLYRHTENGL